MRIKKDVKENVDIVRNILYITKHQKGGDMLEIEEIRKRLEDRTLTKVAEKAGVPYDTLWAVASGRNNPSYETLQKLSIYFENPKNI